jgi:glyoxylase-like metal-dependent hydrolase (beta-lactamase superfamily II)
MEGRVHHLNCGTMHPFSARFMMGSGGWLAPGRLICHCLLVESDDGLLLVDTGIGPGDLAVPGWQMWPFGIVTRPSRDPEETAARQIARRGFDPRDVRHIVLTHLHLDHAGGLVDFPLAYVHLSAAEYEVVTNPHTLAERYVCPAAHRAHSPKWVPHRPESERWFGFDCVPVVEGLSPQVLLVPLPGHTRGMSGVAVRTGDGWLLHCGDAVALGGELDLERPHTTLGGRLANWWTQIDREVRLRNAERLRSLIRDHGDEVQVFCSHDVGQFERLTAGG